MKAYELEATLNDMRGKNIRYNDKTGRLMRYEIKEKTLRLVTDQCDIVILAEDIDQALPTIEIEQHEVAPVNLAGGTSMVSRINGKLESILLDNIDFVKKDKANIPQAQEVNNNVKSLIDLAKAEIEYMKTLAYFHKKK